MPHPPPATPSFPASYRDTVVRVPNPFEAAGRGVVRFALQAQGVSPLVLALYVTLQMAMILLLTWTAGKSVVGSCPTK